MPFSTGCALDVCLRLWVAQVLDNSLEAHVMSSDNSSLAKDCRKDIKAANARLLKLGRKVFLLSHPCKQPATPLTVLLLLQHWYTCIAASLCL